MTPNSPGAAEILMRHLGLTQRTAAEIQDLYSRPLAARVAQTAATKLDQT
jgi:hypothetical protein